MLDTVSFNKIIKRSTLYYQALTGNEMDEVLYKMHLYITDDDCVVMENRETTFSVPIFIFELDNEEFEEVLEKVKETKDEIIKASEIRFRNSITYNDKGSNSVLLKIKDGMVTGIEEV